MDSTAGSLPMSKLELPMLGYPPDSPVSCQGARETIADFHSWSTEKRGLETRDDHQTQQLMTVTQDYPVDSGPKVGKEPTNVLQFS